MKGWTKDGHEVELLPQQVLLVQILLSNRGVVALPPRGRGGGWSTTLATAARMDAEGIDPGAPDPREVRWIQEQWAREWMGR